MKSIKHLTTIIAISVITTMMVACQEKKEKAEEDNLKKELKTKLDESLEANLNFVPECDKEYPLHIYNRLLVKDCEKITDAEKKKMSDILIGKARESSKSICELNNDCPVPQLKSYTFDRIRCKNRLWEVDMTFIFICKKNS